MRYFIDTEYNWEPTIGRITPISIGIVAEDGRVFYAVDANWRDHVESIPQFVVTVVVPALVMDDDFPPCYVHGERATIAREIKKFIGSDTPEFWGDYSDFDYTVLSMLMGEFEDWPDGWPMFIHDIQQTGAADIPSKRPHNALADARAVRDAFNTSLLLSNDGVVISVDDLKGVLALAGSTNWTPDRVALIERLQAKAGIQS